MPVNELEVARLDFTARSRQVMGRVNKEWFLTETNIKYVF